MKRCNTCKGTYRELSADGVPYFHVCPTVVVVKTKDNAGVVREEPLRALVGLVLVQTNAERQAAITAGADPATVRIEMNRRVAPRKDARDERTLRRDGKKGETRVLVSEGRGVTDVADDPTDDVPVDDVV